MEGVDAELHAFVIMGLDGSEWSGLSQYVVYTHTDTWHIEN